MSNRKSTRSAATVAERPPAMLHALADAASQSARRLCERLQVTLTRDRCPARIRELRQQWRASSVISEDPDEFADYLAQTLTLLRIYLGWLDRSHFSDGANARQFLEQQPMPADLLLLVESADIDDWLTQSSANGPLASAQVADLLDEVEQATEADPLLDFYELFLRQHDAGRRKRRGVYFTPRPIVRCLVASVDRALRADFGLADGLADMSTWSQVQQRCPHQVLPDGLRPHQTFLRILDPAMGTGAFLVGVIESVHQTMLVQWGRLGLNATDRVRRWNEFVRSELLPRLFGCEILPAPFVIAHLALYRSLIATGFSWAPEDRLQLHLGSALAFPRRQPSRESEVSFPPDHVTVVVGNPPFSGISANRGSWITGLLKGQGIDGQRTANYYEVDGRPLGEKKLWLQDDYVKFFRVAHWCLDTSRCGVLALVSNHGYLDNPTYRGMRQQLLADFPDISVVDLHGNRKRNERQSDGSPDGNVFDVGQGVALAVLCRTARSDRDSGVHFGELWGSKEAKLKRLTEATVQQIAQRDARPTSPYYLFSPRDESCRAEFALGMSLPTAMPLNTTAPVTARDRFVVDIDRSDLLARMQEFGDLSISDADIRARYFQYTRSARYQPGDTRGWELSAARVRMAELDRPDALLSTCLYRPFDVRHVVWSEWMIDWPRTNVTRHMQYGNSPALIARRQMLPGHPCNYFWITDRIALDGVIRSDNRGSESLFPLYVQSGDPSLDGNRGWRANVSAQCVEMFTSRVDLTWLEQGSGDLQGTFGPEDIMHWIYALFHSQTYRERFADQLRNEFPRVWGPPDVDLFRSLCRSGQRLVAAHLLSAEEPIVQDFVWEGTGCPVVGRGFPKYDGTRIWIDRHHAFVGVPESVWSFQAGAHQVCRKWLRDRRGRMLSQQDLNHYQRILGSVQETLRCQRSIEEVLAARGGWTGAFA